MKYKVKFASTNADHDTSQSESVEFIDAATEYYPHTPVTLATYYTNRFMGGKTKVVLYDKDGKAWPREFVKADLPSQRYLWDICVAHCKERGYDERKM